jgi:enoyl-[acyl-carrier protein] reductase I
MHGLMKGKRGLVMGIANDHSIAWGIAKALAAHGAEMAFTYQGDAQAKRLRPLAQSVGSDIVLPCDVEDIASVDAIFEALRTRWASPTRTSCAAATPTPRGRTSCAPC